MVKCLVAPTLLNLNGVGGCEGDGCNNFFLEHLVFIYDYFPRPLQVFRLLFEEYSDNSNHDLFSGLQSSSLPPLNPQIRHVHPSCNLEVLQFHRRGRCGQLTVVCTLQEGL